MYSHLFQDFPRRQRFDMPAKRTASVNNTEVSLWDGPTAEYVFPVAPIQMQVVSSSANDTLAGTGVRTIHIHYLDNNYVANTMDINMNGVTPVLTIPTNILRINAMHATSVGSNGDAVGNISLQAVGGAVTYAYLNAGHARARHPVYTVPAGKTAFLTQWSVTEASAAAAIVEVEIEASCHDGVLFPGVLIAQAVACGQYLIEDTIWQIPIRCPATTDISVNAISGGATDNATVTSNISGWLESENA
jgi:hypothetical protein